MVETDTAELRVDDDLAFKADPARLKRLFENLFRNALDHGGPDVTVTVGALSDKPGFYVFDDGPGIPEGDGDSVFEPGYTTREEGTGFGLAIVAEMVTAHGWTIQGDRERDRWCSLRDSRCRIRGVNRLTGPVFSAKPILCIGHISSDEHREGGRGTAV